MKSSGGAVGPDFLIIGAQKCGTSALKRNLGAHESISMVDKEVHFFNGRKNWAQGIDWYLEHFSHPGKLQGEKTPDYLDSAMAPGRIAAAFPEVKLLALLRDPVARAYSQWNHMMQRIEDTGRRGWELTSFEEAITRASQEVTPYTRLLDKGRYISQLERYMRYFRREQLFVGIQERFFENGEQELARVFRFLGVEESSVEPRKLHERTYDSPIEPGIQRQLEEYYAPLNQQLFEFLGEEIPEWSSS